MKLAVSGKGGVGKTTFAALLIRTFNEQGKRVLAIDADPDANLAAGLGIADADKIIPIADMEIKLMRLGGIKKGGAGCICPESALLRALVMHIVLARDEVVVMDMEAGIEHLGRATAKAVDKLIVVVEPGRRSIDTAEHIRKLAGEIGLKHIVVVGNKVRSDKDETFLKTHLNDFEFLGFLPYDEALIEADLNGVSPFDVDSPSKDQVKSMISRL
jgi:CO dehydrogenase maturation factor